MENSSPICITKAIPGKDILLPLLHPPSSLCHPVAAEVACPVEPTFELKPQSSVISHHKEHTDLFTPLCHEHQLNDPMDPCSLQSPLTDLDQHWDFD